MPKSEVFDMQNEKLRNVAIIAHVDLVGASCVSRVSR